MNTLFVYSLGLAIISLLTFNNNFSNDGITDIPTIEIKMTSLNDSIPFQGTWTRKFSMGEGKEQQVYYIVNAEEIQYKMAGAVPMEYTIKMDTFIKKDNRWIGKKGEIFYVIFVKNITSDSISLYKQKVKDLEEALALPFPSDTTRSQFTSWNVYQKNIE